MDIEPPQGLVKPSPEVQAFLSENPQASWRQRLHFMLDHVPQMKNGQPQWLLEGGAAIHLRYPERKTPDDIDVITRSPGVTVDFSNAEGFDVKHIKEWFRFRRLGYLPELGEKLLAHFSPVSFDGRDVFTLDPVALVVSKNIRYADHSSLHRKKDLVDLSLIQADPKAVEALYAEVTKYPQQ